MQAVFVFASVSQQPTAETEHTRVSFCLCEHQCRGRVQIIFLLDTRYHDASYPHIYTHTHWLCLFGGFEPVGNKRVVALVIQSGVLSDDSYFSSFAPVCTPGLNL